MTFSFSRYCQIDELKHCLAYETDFSSPKCRCCILEDGTKEIHYVIKEGEK